MVRHHARAPFGRGQINLLGSAAPGPRGDQMGSVRPHPTRPAAPLGSGVDPLAGGHLPRPPRSRRCSVCRSAWAAAPQFTGAIAKEMLHELRLVYFTPAETKDAGFIETDHFGVRFDQRASHFDLTGIPQRWLRDLVWDYLAALLQSPRCPRSGGVIDGIRRAAIELGAFMEADAPGGGHDPTVLGRRAHAAGSSPTSAAANATGCRRWRSPNPAARPASSPR